MIEEDGARSASRRFAEVRVFEDDVRRLSAQLERDFLQVSRSRMHDKLTHLSRPRECDLVHVGMCS